MKPRSERPIALQLLGRVPFFVLLVAIVAATVIWISGGYEVRTQASTATRPLAEAAAYALMPFVEAEDRDSIQRMVDQISANRALEAMAVYDSGGELLAESLDRKVSVSEARIWEYLNGNPQFAELVETSSEVETVFYPIFGQEYNVVSRTHLAGVVVLEPRVDYFWSSYRTISVEAVAMLLLAIGFILFVLYGGLKRLVLRPLATITDAAGSRNTGILEQIALRPESTEFGTLVGALLGMIEQIEEKNRELREHAESLEAAVSERTRELQSSLEELKSTKNLMVRQEKLASIGQLSAGIAHEINNPAGFVHSNLRTLDDYQQEISDLFDKGSELVRLVRTGRFDRAVPLAEEIKDEEEAIDLEFLRNDAKDIIASSLRGMRRIAEIVKHLQRFARRDDNDGEGVEIPEAVDEALQLLHNELKHSCEVELALEECPKSAGNHGRMTQILVNLLMNAKQAMPQGGKITITQECIDGEIRLTITDTGTGMPPEVRERIFDPFYTTKPVGVGTGLGLSIVHGMMESFGGSIDVESEEGRGTTMRLLLPVFSEESSPKRGNNDKHEAVEPNSYRR